LAFCCSGDKYETELNRVPAISVAERVLFKGKLTSIVDFESKFGNRAKELGPLCLHPTVIPVDAEAEAQANGCVLRPPSLDMGPASVALWLCSDRKKGQVISEAGYWGDVCFRKPPHHEMTVSDCQ